MSFHSSTGSGRRKKNTDLSTSVPEASSVEHQQPSSRDASEEAEDSAAQMASTKHKKASTSVDSNNPPAKRPRTRSIVTTENTQSNSNTTPSINKEDPGEPSDTTEASTDIASRSKLKKSYSNKEADDSRVDKKMLLPAKDGLTDPVGYRTNPPPQGRPVRIYADGVFDLFHLGHMRQLEQAKKAFPETYLLVGITGDAETHKRKGLTVLTGEQRAETVRHCKWVDEVVPDCPWIVTAEFLNEHKIDYVAHDDLPYGADEGDDIYKPIKERGQFLVTQRTEGVSTTGIITKIVRDYEQYIARQFKRGTSRQELNVSWLKKNELDIKRHVNELRDSIRTNWFTTGQELTRELRQFWPSRPGSPARGLSRSTSEIDLKGGLKSPTALSNLGHLEIPRQGASNDFAAGYSLGLIGGVRSWMTKSRVSSARGSRPNSPSSSEEDGSLGAKSPKREETPIRGRKGIRESSGSEDAMQH